MLVMIPSREKSFERQERVGRPPPWAEMGPATVLVLLGLGWTSCFFLPLDLLPSRAMDFDLFYLVKYAVVKTLRLIALLAKVRDKRRERAK